MVVCSRQFQGRALEGPGIALAAEAAKLTLTWTQQPHTADTGPAGTASLDRRPALEPMGSVRNRRITMTPAFNLIGAAFRTAEGIDLLSYPVMDSPIMTFWCEHAGIPECQSHDKVYWWTCALFLSDRLSQVVL